MLILRINIKIMNKSIYPCLWFDGQALSAAEFYCSIHPNSKILSSNPMAVVFELNGTNWIIRIFFLFALADIFWRYE